MIQTDRETFQMMLHQIMERFDRIEDRLSRMNRQTSALDGDAYSGGYPFSISGDIRSLPS